MWRQLIILLSKGGLSIRRYQHVLDNFATSNLLKIRSVSLFSAREKPNNWNSLQGGLLSRPHAQRPRKTGEKSRRLRNNPPGSSPNRPSESPAALSRFLLTGKCARRCDQQKRDLLTRHHWTNWITTPVNTWQSLRSAADRFYTRPTSAAAIGRRHSIWSRRNIGRLSSGRSVF